MPAGIRATIKTYFQEELDVIGQCRRIRVPMWQCPRLIFIAMGAVIIFAIIATYFFMVVRTEPEIAALIVIGVAAFLMVQSYIILFATEHIAETSRLKTEFINITSHQLRSPLTASRWAVDLLVSGASNGLPPDTLENLKIIEESNRRMGKLVYALLQVARIEANTFQQRKRETSLTETVKTVMDEARLFARASNIELSFEAPQEPILLFFDPDQLRFIVQELLDNAIRYSGSSKGAVRAVITKKKNSVLCEIHDNGAGIPRDEQKNIFQKFYRGSNVYTLSPTGSGLSLFIVKKVIEAGGGEVGFTSTLNQGSVFWFQLPLPKKNAPAPTSPA